MTRPGAGRVAPLDLSAFEGPRRLGRSGALLRRLPWAVSVPLLEALAVVDGLRRGRQRRVYRWARVQGHRPLAAHGLAIRMLRHHGRFVAEEAVIGVHADGRPGGSLTVQGAEHLEAVDGGVLLLGFHLGPPRTWLALRSLGWPVRMAARFRAGPDEAAWRSLVQAGDIIPLSGPGDAARFQSLYRICSLLRQGAPVFLTADGPFGRDLFRIALPGAALRVRAGWFSVRRQTRVPTLPVFMYAEGRNRVVQIHPALPPPAEDETTDREACRTALTPLVSAFVRAHPEQCRYLVFPEWADDDQPRPTSGQ